MDKLPTMEDLRQSDKDFLTPEEVRGVLGCMAYTINVQAKEDPKKLGFPVCVMGTRVRIPRRAFLWWCDYGNAPVMKEEGQ